MWNSDLILDAHILIVDDQQANVDVVADFLDMQGYRNVRSVTDSREVISLVHYFKPDIILLDLAMPFLSGFDIMDQLKTIVDPDDYLPILVLTADINIETKRKALMSGASDFLTKPFDLIELQARVNSQLQIRKKNEQIRHYSYQLEELIATKDKFFSIIAHDIRNPFAGIENYILIMLKTGSGRLTDECITDLQRIYNTAHQGHELLENLLKWSGSQTGAIKLKPRPNNIRLLIEGCLMSSIMQATDKSIELINEVTDDLFIDIDTDAFNTVFRNLISNAVKFTNKDGVIKVSMIQSDHHIKLAVTDNGVGISADDKEKLFDVGKKLQSRKGTRGEGGSGLGLILCSEFVKLMGGTIEVESEPGKGTGVIVTLYKNTEAS